ncbi:MAG: nitrilase-related carbon-nitrogen hydrolase [Prevotella sp.]
MKVTILQTDIRWGNTAYNIEAAKRLVGQVEDADIIVLPEMWATGFMTDPTAVPDCNMAYEWMRETAITRCCAIIGSLPICDREGKYRNRNYFIKPDGNLYYYDKRHLFGYGGEDRHYVAGSERVIAEYKGIRFLLQTCYDLRFPVWTRNNEDYDVIIYVANWPESRQNAWQILTRARAIENQCYVIAANRTGNDPYCKYRGCSAIIDPKGKTIMQDKDHTQQCFTADIDLERLVHFREKFPVLKDRDKFTII